MMKPLWHILKLLCFTMVVSAEQNFADINLAAGDQWSLDGGILQGAHEFPAVVVPGIYSVLVVKESGAMSVHQVYIEADKQVIDSKRLMVDRAGPKLIPIWKQANVLSHGVVVGPDSTLEVTSSDGEIKSVMLDGQSHEVAGGIIRFKQPVSEIKVMAEDAFGNVSQWQQQLTADFKPPEVEWQLLPPAIQVDNQWYAGQTAVVNLKVSDDHPLSHIKLNDGVLAWQTGEPLPLNHGDVLEFKDALGNVHRENIDWVQDKSPPELVMEVNGQTLTHPSNVRLKVNELLKVYTMDDGVGVATQMYQGKSKKWQTLPKQFRYLNKGRYSIKVKSLDAVGNESIHTIKVKVNRR